MHLAFQIEDNGRTAPMPKSLREIGDICDIPDQQLLRRLLEEHTFSIHTQSKEVEDKHVLAYYVPRWLRGFFFDPNRSRRFYSTSWIIAKCFEAAVENLLPNGGFVRLLPFFVPAINDEINFHDIVVRDITVDGISDATRFLEHVRYGSNRNDLLHFLGNLCEIHWLDIYTRDHASRCLANDIVHWLCTTLVG